VKDKIEDENKANRLKNIAVEEVISTDNWMSHYL
jgi:hypothetical protein